MSAVPAVPLTDAEARGLAARVVKDTKSARVVLGRTNAKPVLHVSVPADQARDQHGDLDPTRAAFTISNTSEWEECVLNQRINRNKNFADSQPTETLMSNNGRKQR